MNAILFGAASLGALLTLLTADLSQVSADLSQGEGSMTTHLVVDSASGDETEIRTIAFMD